MEGYEEHCRGLRGWHWCSLPCRAGSSRSRHHLLPPRACFLIARSSNVNPAATRCCSGSQPHHLLAACRAALQPFCVRPQLKGIASGQWLLPVGLPVLQQERRRRPAATEHSLGSNFCVSGGAHMAVSTGRACTAAWCTELSGSQQAVHSACLLACRLRAAGCCRAQVLLSTAASATRPLLSFLRDTLAVRWRCCFTFLGALLDE